MGCASSVDSGAAVPDTFPDAAELVPQPRIEGGGESVVEGCVATGNICVSFPGYRAARVVDGQMSRNPAQPCAIAAKDFRSGAPLLEVVARPSAYRHPSQNTGKAFEKRRLAKITTPSLLRNGEGKVVGALCTQRKDMESRSCTYVVYATRPRVEGQNAVPIALDDGSELSMFAWAKQTSTHNWRWGYNVDRDDVNQIFLANATGFDAEASYMVTPHPSTGYARLDTSVKARLPRFSVTHCGQLVARGDVAVSENKQDCWYEMDVAPNMDASLLVCAAIIRALIVDELNAKFENQMPVGSCGGAGGA